MCKTLAARVFVLVVLSISAGHLQAKTREAPPALEIVARYQLPTRLAHEVVDVRWSSKNSVFLATLSAGIVEVRLQEGLPQVRRVLPRPGRLSPTLLMSASRDWAAIADVSSRVAWAPLDASDPAQETKIHAAAGACHDLDIWGDHAVLLGVPDGEVFEQAPGGLIWAADLSKGLEHWDALFKSPVAEDGRIFTANFLARGVIRFLPKGDFVAAPNFLEGVYRFSLQGKLKHSWTAEDLWGKAGDGQEPSKEPVGEKDFAPFLRSRRTIEEIIPMGESPAIVVRKPEGGTVRWLLGVLDADIAWYEIPIAGISPTAHLRGDADDKGRIVLIGSPRELYESAQLAKNELVVLRLPN